MFQLKLNFRKLIAIKFVQGKHNFQLILSFQQIQNSTFDHKYDKYSYKNISIQFSD